MVPSAFGRAGWDPFAEMRRMQSDMNRLFAGLEGEAPASAFPPINLWVGEGSLVVTAEVPGIAGETIGLTVREDTLTIEGRRDATVDDATVAWHRRERPQGAFLRTVELPFRVDPDKVQARCVNGILEIELQRPEADKPKRVSITKA